MYSHHRDAEVTVAKRQMRGQFRSSGYWLVRGANWLASV